MSFLRSTLENVMTGNLHQVLGAVWLLGILGSASSGLAQTKRPWVDPPSPTGAQSAVPADPQEAQDLRQGSAGSPPAIEAPEQAASPAETRRGMATERPLSPEGKEATATESQIRPGSAAPPRAGPTVTSRRKPSPQRAASAKRPRRDVSSPTEAELRARGLEIMRLRTIQLPDGRHVSVLMTPNQAEIRDALARSRTFSRNRDAARSRAYPPGEGMVEYPMPH
jgi:hypothetical protein